MNTRGLSAKSLQSCFKRLSLGVLIFYGANTAFASEITNICGNYEVTSYLISGASYAHLKVDFAVLLSGQKWQIAATNAKDIKEWESLTFDGVDTYGLMPCKGHVLTQQNRDLYGSVNGGNGYRMCAISYVDIFYPWLAYSFQPRIENDAMPLPWGPPSWLSVYGYRWVVSRSRDGVSIDGFKIIRDDALNLDEKGEFARLTEYPATAKEFSDQITGLTLRNAVPNGFTNAMLEVKEGTNYLGLRIPKLVTIRRYMFLNGKGGMISEADVSLRTVTVESGEIKIPGLGGSDYVRDFRYAKKRDGRFFPFAEYTNSAAWKPADDPDLLAEANDFLKNGPRMRNYGTDPLLSVEPATRRRVIWTALILLQALMLFLIFRTVKRNRGKQHK